MATGYEDDPGVQCALHQHHEAMPGQGTNGYECTISVADVDATAAAVAANGGKVILARCEIPTVGGLIKIQDPEGNVVWVKQPASA
ncbi:MAG: hypothetical protein ACLQIB_25370 [Isosphaeraceae bacterium]